VLPHLDAAYNLARWLLRDEHDAQDVVQEACVRACRFISGYHGGNPRSWLLKIVRNACHDRLRQTKLAAAEPLDESLNTLASEIDDPQLLLERQADVQAVRSAIAQLPTEFREAIILREMEGLSYHQIAEIVQVPIGTVMSRLARARSRLASLLSNPVATEAAQ